MDINIPSGVTIGHVHLTVSNLEHSLAFYRDILGFEVTYRIEKTAVFLSAGGYHHHIALNTWEGEGVPPTPRGYAGLYHFAIKYPTRKDLAQVLLRLTEAKYPLTGMADHGVSEAIYLNDPDEIGVELYCDRPQEVWERRQDEIVMETKPLNIADLLSTLS